MSFFRAIANIFNPARGVANSVNNLASAENQRRRELFNTYLPSASGVADRSPGNDDYLFSQGAMDDASRAAVAQQYKAEYGEDLLDESDAGFAAQKPRVFELLAKQENEIKAAKGVAQSGVESMRRSRLGNQTGGVRNGVARNPFNMNMMKGPMNTSPAKPKAPAYIGGGGGANPMGQRNYQLL